MQLLNAKLELFKYLKTQYLNRIKKNIQILIIQVIYLNKNGIDHHKKLNYLFQSLNVKELKSVCREFGLKGFSKLKKKELIQFILDSLSEEEIDKFIEEHELEIVSKGIEFALKKIKNKNRENISSIKIVNRKNHELELTFKGLNWETTSFLAITPENINDPDRDCDCRIGGNGGFCSHFWVGFIISLKEGFFKLSDWKLTKLPDNFENLIEKIELRKIEITEEDKKKGKEELSIIDKSTSDYKLQQFLDKSITVHEGEISSIEEKQQQFQELVTSYYLFNLKNVKLGPKITKPKDFTEENLINVENLYLRVSEKLFNELGLKVGDRIKFNGKLVKDSFLLDFVVKNVRKITKL